MRALLIKDLDYVMQHWKVGVFHCIFIIFISLLSHQGATLASVVVLIGITYLTLSFSDDAECRWNDYLQILPLRTEEVVGSKYIFALLSTITFTVLAIPIVFVVNYWTQQLPFATVSAILSFAFALTLVVGMIVITLAISIGGKQSPLSYLLFIFVLFSTVGILLNRQSFITTDLLKQMIQWSYYTPFLAMLLFYSSYRWTVISIARKNGG